MPSASSSPPASAAEPAAAAGAPAAPGLGIYLHWPFCRAKCPYCDFNVHIRGGVDEVRWGRLLATEIEHFRSLAPAGAAVASIYFGGGTPSLMAPAAVGALIEAIAATWPLAADAEISLEANPNDAANFAGYREAGVTRLSLGVQSFDDAALAFLGRDHSAAEARAALATAHRLFAEVSCDLIYALPGQTRAAWRAELAASLARVGGHVSLYQLAIEPGTAFHREARAGRLVALDDDGAADLYALTQQVCADAGLPAYEVSNHARPGHRCRHNLGIWRGGDYVGVGPGAHGRLTADGRRRATRQLRNPDSWSEAVARRGHGTEACAVLDPADEIEEAFLCGLRTVEGISRARFRARHRRDPEQACDADALAELVADGLVETDARGLRATAAGRPLLDAVLGRLLAG